MTQQSIEDDQTIVENIEAALRGVNFWFGKASQAGILFDLETQDVQTFGDKTQHIRIEARDFRRIQWL